jgi:ABC-type amino acid transport substrate-binding protein
MNFARIFRLFFSFVVAGILFLTGCTSQSSEPLSPRLQEIKNNGQLVIGTALTSPFEFLDPDSGDLKGLDIDLANAIAENIGVPIVWKQMAFADLIPALQNGEMDMVIAGMYITDSRKELVDMSEGYVDTGLSFVTQSTASFSTTEELGGKTVCVKTGSTGATYAQKLLDGGIALTIKEYADTPSSLADLSAGACDAVFNDNINSIEYIKTHTDLKVASEILQPAQLGIAVKKGDDELLALVNSLIQTKKQDGSLAALYDLWVLGK